MTKKCLLMGLLIGLLVLFCSVPTEAQWACNFYWTGGERIAGEAYFIVESEDCADWGNYCYDITCYNDSRQCWADYSPPPDNPYNACYPCGGYNSYPPVSELIDCQPWWCDPVPQCWQCGMWDSPLWSDELQDWVYCP